MIEEIIGCPHEEGIDYPEGKLAQFVHTGRVEIGFTGELLH
ncbi:hypothetical protein P4S72_27685 [Vibrio sp. PP-XX7]